MRNKFIISVLIPVLILLAMTVQPLLTLLYGQEIKIKTQPVDPVDIFRGDYVMLSYEIDDIDISMFPEIDRVKESLWDYDNSEKYLHKRVYVTLKENNGIYTAETAGFTKPEQGLYLTGRISYFFNKMPVEPEEPPKEAVKEKPVKIIPDTVKVQYQLDKYFVPDNTGRDLEELSRQGQLIATIKIYKGYALLISLEEAK